MPIILIEKTQPFDPNNRAVADVIKTLTSHGKEFYYGNWSFQCRTQALLLGAHRPPDGLVQ